MGIAAERDPHSLEHNLARVDYALRSLLDLQKQQWPWLSVDETCVVITALDVQYLLLCEPPPGSPYRTSGLMFRGLTVYENRSDHAVLGSQKAAYADFVKQVVGTVMVYHPTQAHITGFAKAKPWLFISSLEALQAYHPAFGPDSTTEEWLSIFVHEFFHARQLSQSMIQADWERILTGSLRPQALDSLYSESDFRAEVDREYTFLARAVQQNLSSEGAIQALHHWLFMRKQRLERFAACYTGDLAYDESVYLYIEGVARYVESQFLVSPDFSQYDNLLANDPHFSGFQAFRGQGYQGMINRSIPQGKYYYALGLHAALLLDRVDPTWKYRVHESPQGLLGGIPQD